MVPVHLLLMAAHCGLWKIKNKIYIRVHIEQTLYIILLLHFG
jgi:hypothetical protein